MNKERKIEIERERKIEIECESKDGRKGGRGRERKIE